MTLYHCMITIRVCITIVPIQYVYACTVIGVKICMIFMIKLHVCRTMCLFVEAYVIQKHLLLFYPSELKRENTAEVACFLTTLSVGRYQRNINLHRSSAPQYDYRMSKLVLHNECG